MKRFLGLIAALLIALPAYAVNSSTAQTSIPVKLYGATELIPLKLVFDTLDTDLTVKAAVSGKVIAVVGVQYSEATAHNMSFTSGAQAIATTLEMPANSGRNDKVGQGIIFATAPGEALKIQVSAAVSTMLVYVIVTDRLLID